MNIEWSTHTPEIDNFGIVVDARIIAEQGVPVSAIVNAIVAFPKEGLFPIEVWGKSIFLTVTTNSNLVLYHGNITRDFFIFPEEVKVKEFKNGEISYQLALSFELTDAISEHLEHDKYYIRVSSCQYQSNISILELTE